MNDEIVELDIDFDDDAIEGVVPERTATDDLSPELLLDLEKESDFQPVAIEIDPDGRLHGNSLDESNFRKRIESELNRSELLPTSPGWTLFRAGQTPANTPEARSEAEEKGEIVMAGTIDAGGIGIMEIVGFLGDSRETGVLTGSVDDVERSVYLRDGDLVGTRSTAPDERLGALLVRMGKLTQRELEAALAHGDEDGERLGQSCVKLKLLSAHGLWEMVKLQHVEIFEQLIGLERGLWHFRRVRRALLESSAVSLPTQYLLMDAVRKLDEIRLYREAIPSFDAVVSIHSDVEIGDFPTDLGPRQAHLAEDFYWTLTDNHDGPSSRRRGYIRDIFLRMNCNEYELSRLLYTLLQSDLIEIHERNPRENSNALAGLEGPVLMLSIESLRGVLKIYARAMQEIFSESHTEDDANRLVESLKAYVVDEEVDLPPSIRMLTVDENGLLNGAEILGLLQSYPIGQTELCAALDTVLFFVLFEATEKLSSGRSEDLIRRVQMIRTLLPKEPT